MSDITQRLEASIRFDAINGDAHERNVCKRQMVEAMAEINRLRKDLADAKVLWAQSEQHAVKADEDRPYWLWRAMLEYMAEEGCGQHDEDGCTCKDDADCITEWCTPCAAAAFLEAERKRETIAGTEADYAG